MLQFKRRSFRILRNWYDNIFILQHILLPMSKDDKMDVIKHDGKINGVDRSR